MDKADILLEPVGRSTAPAIALAADHLIQDVAAFHQAVEQYKVLAGKSKLVTFGVVRTNP